MGLLSLAGLNAEDHLTRHHEVPSQLRLAIARHDAATLERIFQKHQLPVDLELKLAQVADNPQVVARLLGLGCVTGDRIAIQMRAQETEKPNST